MYMYTCTRMHKLYVHVCIHKCTCTCIAQVSSCTYNVHIYVYTCIQEYMYTQACIYIRTCIYMYIIHDDVRLSYIVCIGYGLARRPWKLGEGPVNGCRDLCSEQFERGERERVRFERKGGGGNLTLLGREN